MLEMRNSYLESPGRLLTHKPLAIYVPRKFVQGEQLGRRRYKMEAIQRSHERDSLDWNRNYAVIYEWLKGVDAVQACRDGLIDKDTMASAGQTLPCGSRPQGFLRQRQQAASHHRAAHTRQAAGAGPCRPGRCTGWWISSCSSRRRSGKSSSARRNGRSTWCGRPAGSSRARSFPRS